RTSSRKSSLYWFDQSCKPSRPREQLQKTKGPACRPTLLDSSVSALSGVRSCTDHEGIIGVFGDLPPEIFVVTECNDRIPDLLIVRIGGRGFSVYFVRRLQAGFHY